MSASSKSAAKKNAKAMLSRFPGVLRSEQLREFLVARIATLNLGDKLPGERALASESGLSPLTVNKVLASLAAEGIVERRTGLGTFVRRATEGGSSSGTQLQVLRFVVRDPEEILRSASQGYSALFYKGVREAAAADGIEILPTPFIIDEHDVEALPGDAFGSANVVGLMFVEHGAPDYRPLWTFLAEGRRVIAFDFAAPEKGLNSVLFENAGGIRLAVQHLVRHGHRRIAYVGPAGNIGQPGDERLEGFRSSVAESGLDPAYAAVILSSREESAPAIQKFLRQNARPTGFVAFMDDYLVPVARVAASLGLRVPQDLSLVGFGDGLVREAHPPIQIDSIAFDEVNMGRTAYALWKSGARGVCKRQQPSLVVRGSVATVA